MTDRERQITSYDSRFRRSLEASSRIILVQIPLDCIENATDKQTIQLKNNDEQVIQCRR